MFVDTDTISNTNSLYIGKSAGKVNFNTSASNDYLTNESFKTLRTNVLFSGAEIKSIVFTSSGENEGKSTISAELAKSLAETDKKTLLIDADMRKSVLLRHNSASQNFYGLSEFLSGQAELDKALYNTQNPNFDVIFSGHFPPNPVELLGSKRFKELISSAREVYDYIIIDSPPLGTVIDAAVIASACDGAAIVITPGRVTVKECSEVKEQLEKSGCKILGAILNDVDSKRTKYYKKYYNKTYEYSMNKSKTK
ncbi:MAG: CpsD/CapB family tyrosine-protein kinase [Acutalibacteraceae bacterium]